MLLEHQASKTQGHLELQSQDATADMAGANLDGRYQLRPPYQQLMKLGEGGFGEVWEAEDKQSGQLVAIKILRGLPASELIDEVVGCRAQATARETARKLSLPEELILDCIDTNINDDGSYQASSKGPYLVYELAKGTDLDNLKNEDLRLHQDSIVKQLLQAVYIISKMGLSHKDLKPENIKVSKKSGGREVQVKVLDFGLLNMNDHRFSFFSYPWSPPEAMLEYDHASDREVCPERPDTWDVWGVAAIDYWIYARSQGGERTPWEINSYKCSKFAQSTKKVRRKHEALAMSPGERIVMGLKNESMTEKEKLYMNELLQTQKDGSKETCSTVSESAALKVTSWIRKQFEDGTPVVHRLMAEVLQSPPCFRPSAQELHETLTAGA